VKKIKIIYTTYYHLKSILLSDVISTNEIITYTMLSNLVQQNSNLIVFKVFGAQM